MDEDNGRSSVSGAKLKANHKNAQLSTGPKTQGGKNRSRMNSLKHGILASALLIASGEPIENRAEFDELLCSLNRDLAPVGRLEEMLVEKIAVCWWRQKRALRFEARMIYRASRLEGPSSSSVYEEDKRITAVCKEEYDKRYAAAIARGESEPDISTLYPNMDQVLEYIRNLPEDSDQDWDEFSLPLEQDLSRILRYEASIQRQLVQAINQLERLQRVRKGEHVPAPVTLQVSTDH